MKFLRAGVAALVATAVVWTSAPAVRTADPLDTTPFFTGLGDADALTRNLGAHLDTAQQLLDRVASVTGPHTVENTLRRYDEAAFEIASAQGPANVLTNMHPDDRVRQAAAAILVRARTIDGAKLANRAVYDALAAIDASKADAETRYYLQRELSAFRRNGVDKDAATRDRLSELRASLADAIGQYRQNVTRTTRTVTLTGPDELEGLPADFIARHKPGVTGAITLRPDGADMMVLAFGRREDVRKRLFTEATNVGYPENLEIANRILALRWEIARLLGFSSWAEYDAADRMVRTVDAASAFVDEAIAAAQTRARKEYGELLARKRQDVPGADRINAWEFEYYRELVRRANYDFDSQLVRPYFAFDRVKQGLLDVTSRLYGVTYRRASDVPVWHPSVEAYDVLADGRLIGRVYFDAHPRQNKQNAGALTALAHGGLAGRQIPEAVLQASLPGGQPGDPGLLTYSNVRDLFHEYGHAMHRILSGQPRYYGLREEAEGDFREVTAQLFEEWTIDPKVLATFARHYQTNEPIPAELVARLRRANEFAKGMFLAGQLAFARFALLAHQRDPKTFDVSSLMRETLTSTAPWLYAEGNHREASFTHFANTNYMSAYYSYLWSLAIAKDMLGQFDRANLLASGPAHRLRDVVMKPGGSRPASDLVRDFLGRPFTLNAWNDWINRDPS